MSFHADEDQLKVRTVSRKSERLVSLTIALLATKRFLTKREIFNSIEGYEGEDDAKERMFERDKEDLRNLGITIEVGSFDPFFEDDAGYRIRVDDYQLEISELTPTQLGLLSLASTAWQDSVLDGTSLSALVKLKSLGVESDFDGIPKISPRLIAVDPNVARIIDAVSHRQVISFTYIQEDLNEQIRAIEPYGTGTKNGHWYVAGRDLDRNELRVFRLDRILGEIAYQGKNSSYVIPSDFRMQSLLQSKAKLQKATLEIRRGKAHSLLARAENVVDNDEWIRIVLSYSEVDELVRDVLWYLDDVKILEPEIAREQIIRALDELIVRHG
jgi:proteasome accessory factor B